MTLPAPMEPDSMEDVFLQDNLGPSIAEHASQCNRLFRKYIAMPEVVADPTLLDDQRARFTLWSSNMDVSGPLNVSLDYRLRYSPTIVDIIHQLLDVICNSLTSLQPTRNPPQTITAKKRRITEGGHVEVTKRFDDYSSDSESDEDPAQKAVSLITYTIGGTVTRLYRLSNAIRKSATASRTSKIREYKDDDEANNAITELRLYTECYIGFVFPQAPQTLRSALVEANAMRLRRLYYQRSHRRRIALSVQHPQANQKLVQLPKMPDRVPAVHFASSMPLKPKTSNETKPNPLPPAPVTYATTAQQTVIGALYAESTVAIPRAKSVLVNNKLSFPPVPATNECPYCGVIVEFKGPKKTTIWNDHVMRDLEPFICVFPHCTNSSQKEPGLLTFDTSKAWMSHMQNAHGYAWECRAPSHDPIVFKQEVEFQEHSHIKHGVPEAHVGTLSSAARRPILEKVLECPFGDDFSAPESTESNTIFSNEALHLHIASHMKKIALLALQKLPREDDEKSEEVASDAPLEDDGIPNLRGSMYSVLDDEALDFQDETKDDAFNIMEEGINSSIDNLDLEDKDNAGMTALHRAVRDNSLHSAESLIQQGANARSRANDGKTALHYACLQLHVDIDLDIMKLLLGLSQAKEAIDLKDDNGQTPIHYAARRGHNEGIKLLADYGASINVLDSYGFSPYLWAVIAGNNNTVKLLLSLGVDINSTDMDGKSALQWAASQGHRQVVELLLEMGAEIRWTSHLAQLTSLEEPILCDDQPTVRMLLEFGADPNYRDREGWSAIHWAAEQGLLHVVHLLLNYGANLNAVSSYGTTPLHCAANGGHDLIVNELLQRGADPLQSTCHGWTPLHHAAFMGHASIVSTLLDVDGLISGYARDNHGWLPLHLAVLGRHLDTVKVLLERPVIWHGRIQHDDDGRTAAEWLEFQFDSHFTRKIRNLAFDKSRCCRATTRLRKAVHDNNTVMTELLLEQGCDVNGTDSGRTALYHAAKNRNVAIMNMVLEKGADPNILPPGRGAWEEFISDDAILVRLRQAGYTKPVPNVSMIEHQIRNTLTNGNVTTNPTLPVLPPQSPTMQPTMLPPKSVEPRSRVSKIWKRMRGGERNMDIGSP